MGASEEGSGVVPDPKKADGVGIYQMATGSGKTRTAIDTIREAIKLGKVDKSVIVVPKTLEEQWGKNCRSLSGDGIRCILVVIFQTQELPKFLHGQQQEFRIDSELPLRTQDVTIFQDK